MANRLVNLLYCKESHEALQPLLKRILI